MEFFRIRKDIPFMRHALVFNVISLLTFLLAVFFLFSRGLHLSVEFSAAHWSRSAIRRPPTSARSATPSQRRAIAITPCRTSALHAKC